MRKLLFLSATAVLLMSGTAMAEPPRPGEPGCLDGDWLCREYWEYKFDVRPDWSILDLLLGQREEEQCEHTPVFGQALGLCDGDGDYEEEEQEEYNTLTTTQDETEEEVEDTPRRLRVVEEVFDRLFN